MWDYEWMFCEFLWIDWYGTRGTWQSPHVIAVPASAEDHSRPKGKWQIPHVIAAPASAENHSRPTGKPRPRLGYTT